MNAFVTSICRRMKRFRQLSIGINQSWIITEYVHHESTHRHCRSLVGGKPTESHQELTNSVNECKQNASKIFCWSTIDCFTTDLIQRSFIHVLSYRINLKKIGINAVILMSWFTQFNLKLDKNFNFTSNYHRFMQSFAFSSKYK